jgi:hypothetical protein
MVHVRCLWCGREVNRSPSALSRVNHVFCSKVCKNRFEEMKREVIKEADEKDWLSRCLNHELDLWREDYGGNG